jgi:formylglycine-generating enzyme required for sulfatase activity
MDDQTDPFVPQTTEPPPDELEDATAPRTTLSTPWATPHGPDEAATCAVPAYIGRYQVLRLLARGNFLVYLAYDPEIDRAVAIKIARPGDSAGRRRIMSLAQEARKLEGLNHPRIVRLYEYVPGEAGNAAHAGFIVLEYVEGQTLETLLQEGCPPPRRLAAIIAQVADAVHHAHVHQTGLVHRDLKPSNILLDLQGEPHVCDFGLAVDAEVQRLRRHEVAGTLHYMAPEQVRGETHRLDGRTDIWALGVILYRGLTGKLPFPGRNPNEIFDEILHRDPRPPRMSEPSVCPELERICLRCLSRPMCDRYLTAADLAADLERWLTGITRPHDPHDPARVVPKGLLAFDLEDARFFLNLLPGPRRGDGLPESIRFWKDRIEALEGDKLFGVGLLYGPSGGGKTSFVKAGLIPNLDQGRVRTVYLEATPGSTEAQLEAQLRRLAPALPADADLADSIAILRDDERYQPGGKFCLVLDQFEQWLQARSDEPEGLLVRALRHCDGRRVQALLLVRDDFWMALTRFLRAVEVPLVQGGNAAAVELFDASHARKVLEEFGRALGRLPSAGGTTPDEASRFLDEVIKGLTAPEGRVIPVRLSLFTEVVRHRAWTLETLRTIGGVEGIGVKFLEDRFESESSPHRVHRNAAQAILQALLPPPASVIRGAVRTETELRAASGYAERPGDFAAIMHVLDHELRLVTATDPPEATGQQAGSPPQERPSHEIHYQLAHDYLIRSVRQWLERDQRSTPAGRSRLRLQLVTASWLQHPGRRQLPSLLEWAGILRHVPRGQRSADEQRLMRATARYYTSRVAAALLCIAALAAAGKALRDRDHARALLQSARAADDRKLLALLPDLERYRTLVSAELEAGETAASSGDRPVERALAGVLLYRLAPTSERGRYLRELLLAAPDPDRLALCSETLLTHPDQSGAQELWPVLKDESAAAGRRLRAAAALARLAPQHPDWNTIDPVFARALLLEDRGTIPRWIELLEPALALVVRQLDQDVRASALAPSSREASAAALTEALIRRGTDAAFAGPIAEATPAAFHVLVRGLKRFGRAEGAIDALRAILDEPAADPADQAQRDRQARRQATAAIALLALGHPEHVWPRLRHAGDPRLRSLLIDRLGQFDVSTQPLLDRLRPDVDPIELQGVLLALAEIKARTETGLERVPPDAAGGLVEAARQLYLQHPHPGVHSAAELLLRRWQQQEMLRQCDKLLRKGSSRPKDRRWELGPNNHTLVIISGPMAYRMGSPTGENDRFLYENQHVCRINRSLAVATKEVTIEQYRAFDPKFLPESRYADEPTCPANRGEWLGAVRYCNWLSAQAGIEPDQCCYPVEIGPGMVMSEDSVERCGFRLPTEAEWEYICRAQTETARPFGESQELFSRYAWTWLNSEDRAHPVGLLLPNELGLFDILGNVWEWCQDGPANEDPAGIAPYPPGSNGQPARDRVRSTVIVPGTSRRILRGGAFDYSPLQARSAHRYTVTVDHVEGTMGFRVVRTLPPH